MKRLLCILLSLLLLAGCSTPPAETTAPPETTLPIETTDPTVPTVAVSADVLSLREDLPRLDGSTSLIPLEAGIRAAIFDISPEEASAQVAHTTTWSAFYSLLHEEVDLIFSTPLSADQQSIADDQGVALETFPIAMEGFVFVVNADNPVDALTQEQLRDIYSGKITNWSQVGGPDLPIIPYQRNADSGSQNFMIDFMGNVPLMDAPVELRPATMEGLMDIVAVNDNTAGSIGYSVYTYAADMYSNGDDIKFIKVDGVAPSKQTMASGEYPLLGKYYAIFRADEPEDSNVRTLVRWMSSYDGQTVIAKAGYVTLEDIGFDYREQTLTLWQGTGSGPAAGAPASYEWSLTQVKPDEWGGEFSEFLPLEVVDGVYRVVGITDPKLESEINAFIAKQMEWIPNAHDAFSQWVDLQNRGDPYGSFSAETPWDLSRFLPEGPEYVCFVTAKNGYLSVAVSVCGMNNMVECEYLPYRTETATWDLLTGKRLSVEDLFCRGVDVDAVLNGAVRAYSLNPTDSWGIYPSMKQDFAGLPMTGWHVTHDAIYIDQDNPYFATSVRIPLDKLPDGVLACEAPRDFGGTVDQETIIVHKNWRITDRDSRYAYNSDSLVSCGFLKEEVHPNAARINAEVMEHLNTYFTTAAITEYYAGFDVDIADVEIWMLDWDLWNLGGKYLLFQGPSPYHMTEREEDRILYPAATFLLYDLETGEQIPWTTLVRDNWRDGVSAVHRYPGYVEAELPRTDMVCDSIYPKADGSLDTTLLDGAVSYTCNIPADYVNYE